MSVTEKIDIVVSDKGTVTVKKNIAGIGTASEKSSNSVNMLSKALYGVSAALVTRAIFKYSDAYTNLTNKLRLVADGLSSVNERTAIANSIARKSLTDIGATASLYQRTVESFNAMGKSAKDAAGFVERFQKAAVLSGSDTQSTTAAVYQFTQALNKGKLDGDEFRAVMETLPYVTKVLRDQLGLTQAELYEWAAAGKLSVDTVIKAFAQAGQQIDKDFSKVIPTLETAFSYASDQIMIVIGRFNDMTGAITGLAYAIYFVADNFMFFLPILFAVGAALLWVASEAVLGLVISGLTGMATVLTSLFPILLRFNALSWANPYVLLAAAIVATIAAIVYFRNELGITDERLTMLWETAKVVFNNFMIILAALWEYVQPIFLWIWQTGVAMFAAIGAALTEVWQIISPLITDLYNLFMEVYTLVSTELIPVFAALWVEVSPILKLMWEGVKLIIGVLWELVKLVGGEVWETFKFVLTAIVETIKVVVEAITGLIRLFTRAIQLARQLGGGGSSAPSGGGGQYLQAAPGFNDGGQFMVGGSGAGRDRTPVAFNANRGERVTVETRKQQREGNSAPQAAPQVTVPVGITNVFDPNSMTAAIESSKGRKSILNNIVADKDNIRKILGVV